MTLDERQKKFINRSKEKYGDKYDYSKVIYQKSNEKVEIICREHGSFFQIPQSHYLGDGGCPECARKIFRKSKNRKPESEFLEQATLRHSNKYDYSKVTYVGSHVKVIIICPIHGEWMQTPGSHLAGNGCPFCAGVKSNTDIFVKKSIKLHGDRYDYSEVEYVGKMIKVKIICKEHGLFQQIPKRHLAGLGCPNCSDTKGEAEIKKYLKLHNIEFAPEYCFPNCKDKGWLRFDFYLPDQNTVIEYDGKQHFEPIEWFGGLEKFVDLQRKDSIKSSYCENNGIRLIRIKYNQNINDILSSSFELAINNENP